MRDRVLVWKSMRMCKRQKSPGAAKSGDIPEILRAQRLRQEDCILKYLKVRELQANLGYIHSKTLPYRNNVSMSQGQRAPLHAVPSGACSCSAW